MQFSKQLIAVVVLCAVTTADEDFPEDPVVQTAQGKLRGRVVNSWSGKKIISFIGVRFAEPPTGPNRFKPPVPARPWTGVRNATEDGPLCPVPGRNDTSEDCLFLCVHTRNLNARHPVIIYFHPGGFAAGTGNNRFFGPQYWLDHDIVLVSFNYRLGPLGFLSTGDSVLPGNYGLKDQLLVMNWVRQNVAQFGGDPHSVTLFGYSAGGGSVQLHLLSPSSKGLFHRAIASSCSATTASVLNRDPLTLARRFANLLNCPTETSLQIRECLLRLPEANITAARTRIWDTLLPPTSTFGPVIEREGGDDRFLRDDPVSIIQSGRFTQVPLITGITRDEFSWRSQYVLTNSTYLNRLNSEFHDIAPFEYRYPRRPRNVSRRISSALRQFYFNNQPVSNATGKQLGELYADSSIIFSVYQAAKLIAEKSSAPVYFYMFNYEGRFSYNYHLGSSTPYGVSHHDDLIYLLYNSVRFPLFNQTDPEADTVRKMTSLYTRFARTGSPSIQGSSVKWSPMTTDCLQFLNISDTFSMRDGLPYPHRMHVWETQLPFDQPYRQLVY